MSLMPFWKIRGFRFVKLVEFSQPAIEMALVGFSAAALGRVTWPVVPLSWTARVRCRP